MVEHPAWTVIFYRDLMNCSIEEIKENLASQSVSPTFAMSCVELDMMLGIQLQHSSLHSVSSRAQKLDFTEQSDVTARLHWEVLNVLSSNMFQPEANKCISALIPRFCMHYPDSNPRSLPSNMLGWTVWSQIIEKGPFSYLT